MNIHLHFLTIGGQNRQKNGGKIMEQQHCVEKNTKTNKEDSVTTNLFDILVNLQGAEVIENNKRTITTDLLDITIDTHGVEVTEELIQMSKQKNETDLFDVLVDLHGAEMTKELIYTCGKMNGLNFGKQLGKCDDPQSAIKHIHAHIQSHCEINADDIKPNNEKCAKTINFKNGLINKLLTHKKTVSLNPLHIRTQGFIEGTLSFMTGMQVNIDITNPDKDKIDFKPEKSFFGFM